MMRRIAGDGLIALALALALAACKAPPALPGETVTSPPAAPAATDVSTEIPEPTLGEPATLTPGLPTPVAEPLAHLPPGEELAIQSIHMVDTSTGWAIGRAEDDLDRIVRTSDGGLTWTDVTPPEAVGSPDDPRWAFLSTWADAQHAWAVYSGVMDLERGPIAVVVWRTADGGATWNPSRLIGAPEGSGWFEPLALGVLDDGFGWLMAAIDAGMMHQYIALYTTQDGGDAWTRVLDPYGDQPVQSCPKTGLAFADSSIGWMTRDCGGLIDQVTLITTADGGATWIERPVSPPSGLPGGYAYSYLCAPHSIRLDTPRAGMLAVSCFQYLDTPGPGGETKRDGPHALYRTDDGGMTWTAHDYPGGQLSWLDESRGWAFSRDIYRTRDGGATWQLIHTVNWDGQFSFVDEDHGWAVARNEEEIALVRTEDGGASWSILRPVAGP
ncbi:MAG: hypothetical protein NTU91_12535 [Chloroflexi bacterium]|nr:hypothetical protein [Chloroflexota bacterium]